MVVDVLAVTCINFVLATQPSGYITEVLPSRLDAVLRYYPAAWVHYRGTPYITEVLPAIYYRGTSHDTLPRYSLLRPLYPAVWLHCRGTPYDTLPRYSSLRPSHPAVWLHHRGTNLPSGHVTEVLPTLPRYSLHYRALHYRGTPYITDVLPTSSSLSSRLGTLPRYCRHLLDCRSV